MIATVIRRSSFLGEQIVNLNRVPLEHLLQDPYRSPADTEQQRPLGRGIPRLLRCSERRVLPILTGVAYTGLCVAGAHSLNATFATRLPDLLFLLFILAETPFNLPLMIADHLGFGFYSSLGIACLFAFSFAATIHYTVCRLLLAHYWRSSTESEYTNRRITMS